MYKGIAAIVLVGALALAGCDTAKIYRAAAVQVDEIAEAETENERLLLTQVARADLEEALRSAEAHGDEIGAMCWSGLLEVLDTVQAPGYFTDVKGAFSAYQKARNVRRKITEGDVERKLRLSCAALKEDAKSAILDIAGIIPGL